MSRRGKRYEFSDQTKEYVRHRDQCCQACGKMRTKGNKHKFEIHHNHIYVWEARYHNTPASLVKSSVNALMLCEECHDELHSLEERTHDDYIRGLGILAQALGYMFKNEVA